MSTFKRVKVLLLPTENPSSLILNDIVKGLFIIAGQGDKIDNCTNQHLYFLSDEEIKEGDWCICDYSQVEKYSEPLAIHRYKKIIATTDSSLGVLVKSGTGVLQESLPQPFQSFIEKFIEKYNQGNPITEAMVECELNEGLALKQIKEKSIETSAYILKVNPKDNTITIKPIKDSWSEKEIFVLFENYLQYLLNPKSNKELTAKQWIEENL